MADLRPTPDDPTEPRVRLLEAAVEEFAERGFDAASVRDICKRAGMNVAAVNYYYRDKESLYIEAVKRAHSCNFAEGEEYPEPPAGTPPAEQLRHFITVLAGRMQSPGSPAAMKLVMREMADPGRAAHVVVEEFIRPMAHRLRGIVRELLPGAPEEQTLLVGFSVIGQLLYYRQNRPISEILFGRDAMSALSADAVAGHVARFTLAALGHAEPIRVPEGPS